MSSISLKKRVYLCMGIVFLALIPGCKASRVLLPELHRDDTNWIRTETAHYFIYYRPDSPASENIEEISVNLDSCFVDVLIQLEVHYTAKIHYYLYNSYSDIEHSTHRLLFGYAVTEFEGAAQVYSSVSQRLDAHETVHVIAHHTIGVRRLLFLAEGIAEATAHAHDKDSRGKLTLHMKAETFLYRDRLYALSDMADNDWFREIRLSGSGHVLYTTSGSFVRYLIDECGLQQFKMFYPRAGEDDYEEVFGEIYGKSIHDFEEEWHEFLRNY